MANSASARKSARQAFARRIANQGLKTNYRTAVKSVKKAIASGDKTLAKEAFFKAQSEIDSIADKGLVHKNKAARQKSRLNSAVRAMK